MHTRLGIVRCNRIAMLIARHVFISAVELAVYVVVAAVGAGRVSGCVWVPAASVGGCGGWRGGAARCGLSGLWGGGG